MSQVVPEPMYTIKHRLRYKLDYKNLINLLLFGLMILIGMLWMFIFVQLGTRVTPIHFKLNQNLQIIEPIPLDQEGISKPALLNWVNEALTKSFSFNYSNQDKQAAKLTEYYSEKALKIYTDMLANDEDFAAIKTDFYVVSIHPTAAPEIVTSKAFQGRYAWQIKIPALIRFSNAVKRMEQSVNMEFLVWRVPETESPIGIIIATFNRTVTGKVAPHTNPQGF